MVKLFKKALQHKVISVIILLLIIGGVAVLYRVAHKGQIATRYVLSTVEKGNLLVTVSGSGQVSASNQVDIKPTASGDIVSVAVKQGDEVKKGQLIAQLDAANAYRSVRDAQASLDSALLSLQKLQQPPTDLQITQAQTNLDNSKNNLTNAQDSLAKAYDDGFNNVANVFLDLPSVMSGLDTILFDQSFIAGQDNYNYYADSVRQYNSTIDNYRNIAYNSYQKARAEYNDNFDAYKNASRFSDNQTIESLIDETYNTSKDVAQAVKDLKNYLDFYKDLLVQNLEHFTLNSTVSSYINNLETYTGQTNTFVSSLLSSKNSIDSDKQSILTAQNDIKIKQQTYDELIAGADPLDIQTQQLSIQQRRNALADAQATYADYSIRAPFDGIIASVDAKVGAQASSGTALATEITQQSLAEIALNEIDAAKVKVGQKVTLTFDAIPDLTITGQVAEVDSIGTVSQGVVSYNVTISFDVQDNRIKPGMSFSANIITDAKPDVLSVPSSAVKTANSSSYVEILVNGQPQRKSVTTGLSNDTSIEIIDGLQEGDQVISQTISGSSSANTSSSQNNRTGGFGGGAVFRLGGG